MRYPRCYCQLSSICKNKLPKNRISFFVPALDAGSCNNHLEYRVDITNEVALYFSLVAIPPRMWRSVASTDVQLGTYQTILPPLIYKVFLVFSGKYFTSSSTNS